MSLVDSFGNFRVRRDRKVMCEWAQSFGAVLRYLELAAVMELRDLFCERRKGWTRCAFQVVDSLAPEVSFRCYLVI